MTHVLLNGVPGLSHLCVIAVHLDGGMHFLLHPIVNFKTEDIAEDASRHHDYEKDYQDYKIREKHAFYFLVGAKSAQEGDD